MGTVEPIHVTRPGYVHQLETPRAVQIDLTYDLLLEVLKTRRSVAMVVKVWTFETRCGRRQFAPITEGEILQALVNTRTAANAAAHLTRWAYGLPTSHANHVVLRKARMNAAVWWAAAEQQATGIRAVVRKERLAALELAGQSL